MSGVAAYGGSLDVIVDDAEESERLMPARRRGDADRGRADRARPRLLPGLDDRRASQDLLRARPGDRRGRRDRRQERAGERDRRRHQRQLDAGVELLEGLLVKKAGLTDADRADRRACTRAPRRPDCATSMEAGSRAAADRRGLHEGHADARPARSRGADRGREPIRARSCATSRAAASRRACSMTPCATQSPEKLPRSPVIGTDAPVQYEQREDVGAPRKRLPARADERGVAERADPGAIRVRARDQRRRRDRRRSDGSDRRRGSSPAATACCR